MEFNNVLYYKAALAYKQGNYLECVQNPECSAYFFKNIYEKINPKVVANKSLYYNEDIKILSFLLLNKNCPPEILEENFNHSLRWRRLLVAQNKNCPSIFKELLNDEDKSVQSVALRNPRVSAEKLEEVFDKTTDIDLRISCIRNINASLVLIEKAKAINDKYINGWLEKLSK